MGLVKLATMAATEICRLESGKRQPGCRPKQAACPYFPSLGQEERLLHGSSPTASHEPLQSCSEQKPLVTPCFWDSPARVHTTPSTQPRAWEQDSLSSFPGAWQALVLLP